MGKHVEGVDDVKRALAKVEGAFGTRGVVKGLMQGGLVFERAAKRNIRKQELIDLGELRDSTEARLDPEVKIGIEVGPTVEYAAIHEFGGTVEIPITTKMRKFAWWQWYESNRKNDMWKGLALTKKKKMVRQFPARPYMRPAFDEEQKNALKAIRKGYILMLANALGKKID